MALSLMQLLELVDKAKSQKERGDLLKQNQTHHLENLLWYTFHPDVRFLLPEGKPPFNRGRGRSRLNITLRTNSQIKIFRGRSRG
jgi:hypothetical protein